MHRDRRSVQSRLTDFGNDDDGPTAHSICPSMGTASDNSGIWTPLTDDQSRIVCEFDGTVFLGRLVNGVIYAHGHPAVCRWCGGNLQVRGEMVFCGGPCGAFQGRISRDLNKYLEWNGALSYTLRREIADTEGLELDEEERSPPTFYGHLYSPLDEFAIEDDDDSDPDDDGTGADA